MGNAFQAITDSMGEVIERVDTPLIASMRMGGIPNSVDNWVSEGCIRMLIINFSPKHVFAFFIQTHSHFIK